MTRFSMRAGWLDDITGWFRRQFEAIWDAILQLVGDAILLVVDTVLGLFAALVEAIPVPGFLQSGLGGMFAQIDPGVLYFVGVLKVPEGLALIAAGVTFRLLRKLFTLGQW